MFVVKPQIFYIPRSPWIQKKPKHQQYEVLWKLKHSQAKWNHEGFFLGSQRAVKRFVSSICTVYWITAVELRTQAWR